jgi:Reverse transcriptase (RNA-dependent DNA polymerase)
LSDRGRVCVFVGYPSNHARDLYRLLNLKTNHVIKSRDVIWSNKTYGVWMKSKDYPKMTDDDLSDTEVELNNHPEPKESDSSDKSIERAQNKKALKQMSKFKSWFNPDPSRFIEVQDSGRDLVVESVNFAFNSLDLVEEPKTFAEAYNNPNTNDKIKWREAILKEFDDMSAKGVWKKIQNSDMPNGRNCMIFKIKRNGVYCARLVAWGYSQVPGVDFQESFAPVINDVTFRILLLMMLTWNLKAKFVDIETAFLHGDLKETIYMEIPKGMEVSVDECLILNKTIYGLVQSAREFYNKLVSALKDCRFQGSLVDPCLWIKHFN